MSIKVLIAVLIALQYNTVQHSKGWEGWLTGHDYSNIVKKI